MVDLGNSLDLVIVMVVRGVAVEVATPLQESDATDVFMWVTLSPGAKLRWYEWVTTVVMRRSQHSCWVSRCYPVMVVTTVFTRDNLGNSSLDVVARHLGNLVTRDIVEAILMVVGLTSSSMAEDVVAEVGPLLVRSSVTGAGN